jgi:hypothetical protein
VKIQPQWVVTPGNQTKLGVVNYFVTASKRTAGIKQIMTYLTSSMYGTIKIQRENSQIFQDAGHIYEALSFDRTDRRISYSGFSDETTFIKRGFEL